MRTNDRPISELMKSVHEGLAQLPDFQRGWVWDDTRIKSLIASITNNYPVGAAMFLEYGNENIRFKYRVIEGSPAEEKVPNELILDGQQRLTSIYSSLYSGKPVHTRTDKGDEITRYYYIDIEQALDPSCDRIDAIISVPETKIVTSNFGRTEELNLTSQEKEFQKKMFPLNIILDYVFIFPLGWGLEGAAIATSISFSLCGVAEWVYILFFAKTLRLYPLKLSLKSCWLTIRNLAYQVRMGFSVMLGEVAVSGTIIVGNYVFMHYLGESGVAAYSVICYCFPIIFMFANSIVQSAQPIVSFAYGASSQTRLSESFRLIMRFSLLVGLLTAAIFFLLARYVPLLFLDASDPAYAICEHGVPYFSLGIVFIVLNIVWIGYMQSVEQSVRATVFTLLRGFLLVIPCFLFLPVALGTPGIWLAIPLAELSTFLFIFAGAKK